MILAVIAGGWTGDGLRPATAFQPKLKTDYPEITVYRSIAGDAPAPAVCTVECTQETLDRIDGHTGYTIVSSQHLPESE